MPIQVEPVLSVGPYFKTLFYLMLVPLILYSVRFYVFGTLGPLIGRKAKEYPDVPENELPKVSIHVPVYNDAVVKYCVEDCLNLDYPKDKVEVIVADDSTDSETMAVINSLGKLDRVKVLHRESREGFKAGALNNALKHSTGDVIVILDADYRVQPDFLKKLVRPFHSNEKIAFVQSRWAYLNPDENLIARIASMSFTSFHNCCLPIQNKINTAIFCGSGGAIRKHVLEEVGGWNANSITEDLDLSVRTLKKGYTQEYLPDVKAFGEVPTTLKAYVRQQQRWAYGTTIALVEYLDQVMFSDKMHFWQKVDFSLLLTSFLVFPFITGVIVSAQISASPFFGIEAFEVPATLAEVTASSHEYMQTIFSLESLLILLATGGFYYVSAMGLLAEKRVKDTVYIPLVLVIGFVVQLTSTLSVIQALLGIPMEFYKTPKKAVNK